MVTSYDREQFFIRRLWELHKSPRDHIDGLLDRRPHPQYSSMNEQNGNWLAMPAQPRSDQHKTGFQYGSDQIDNSPRERGFKNVFNDKSSAERRKLRQFREEAISDIDKFKQEKRMMNYHREEEIKREDNRRRKFWEDQSYNTVTYAREPQNAPAKGHDLFLNTLGGPGGTVVRKDGGPGLTAQDPHRSFQSPEKHDLDLAEKERTIREERAKIAELKKELEFLKSPRGQEALKAASSPDRFQHTGGYEPSFGMKDNQPRGSRQDFSESRQEEKRSLDLEATRGGAGAPLKDDRGKPITRYPNTMGLDAFGGHKIQEQIPGKRYRLPEEPPYDPFGKPGGGAPMVDRYGKRMTATFGNFEKKVEEGDLHKRARCKEVLRNELNAVSEQQKLQKEEEQRQLKAGGQDLATIMQSKEVGKPRRDPITGTLASQHLPNSDVSRLKMNYQPVEASERINLRDTLKDQVENNERNRHLEKLRKRQEAMQHFQNFDQTWGHFGGGAPKDRYQRKKVNLDNALYHFDRECKSEGASREGPQYNGIEVAAKPVNESYKKRLFEEDIRHMSQGSSPRYVKNTTKSTSQNLYEYPTDKSPRNVPLGPAPYATGSAHAY